MTAPKAVLGLADGLYLFGDAYGKIKATAGELVFNTAMTGYQEIITDPSYLGQIIVFTYPHIGNTGINDEDDESARIHAAGLALRNISPVISNWRARRSLEHFLNARNCAGISGLDTRLVTRHLRDHGCQNAAIIPFRKPSEARRAAKQAIAKARSHPSIKETNLARLVSGQGEELLAAGSSTSPAQSPLSILVYDCGIKHNIMRSLARRNCRLIPAQMNMPAADLIKTHAPDGILVSNGPGDPAACTEAIANIRVFLRHRIPLFGICLGHQLLGLACGMEAVKMKFGHHGANHPVQDLKNGIILISSQNHNFTLNADERPANIRITHRSLFDNTVQGIELVDGPAFSFQGHPEASPGPHDGNYLFDKFTQMAQQYASQQRPT